MGYYNWKNIHKIKPDPQQELLNESIKILSIIDRFFDKIIEYIEKQNNIDYIEILETFCDELAVRDIYDGWFKEYQKKNEETT